MKLDFLLSYVSLIISAAKEPGKEEAEVSLLYTI